MAKTAISPFFDIVTPWQVLEQKDAWEILYLAIPACHSSVPPSQAPIMRPHNLQPEIVFTKTVKVRPVTVYDIDALDYGPVTGPSKRRAPEEAEDQRVQKAARVQSDMQNCMRASEVADQALVVAMNNAKRAHLATQRMIEEKLRKISDFQQ